MKIPMPKNKLVMLTLVGALIAVIASVALATPGLLQTTHEGDLPPGAPPTDTDFQPEVQYAASDGEHEYEEEAEAREEGHRGGDDDERDEHDRW